MTTTPLRRVKPILLDCIIFCLLLLTVAFSKNASQGAALGLKRCAETLVPSLFPFMALCIFSIQSGFAKRVGKWLAPITRALFYLPSCAGTTILIGLVGGYPVGARSISSLLDAGQINREQARRMLCFCVGAGPAFVISAVGVAMLHSLTAGMLLFGIQAGCALLLGIILGLRARWKKVPLKEPDSAKDTEKVPMAEALVRSVEDAATSTLVMCAFVILFSAFLGVLSQLGVPALLHTPAAQAVYQLFFEVTAGVSAACLAGDSALFLIALALGWAGMCVHFQIFSSLPNLKIPFGAFYLSRLCHGLAAAFATLLLFSCLPDVVADVFGPVMPPPEGQLYSNLPFGLSLLFMCGLFLLCLPKKGMEFPDEA